MHSATTAASVESELADVLQYLIRLADVLGVDLGEAVRRKVQLNETRFPLNPDPKPAATARGRVGSPDKEPFLVLEVAGHPASYSSPATAPWQKAVRAEIARKHAKPRKTRFGVRITFRIRVSANKNEVWHIDNLVKQRWPGRTARCGVGCERGCHGCLL
jgi:hypothetical protein